MAKDLNIEWLDGKQIQWKGEEGVTLDVQPGALFVIYPDGNKAGIPLRNVRQWWTSEHEAADGEEQKEEPYTGPYSGGTGGDPKLMTEEEKA